MGSIKMRQALTVMSHVFMVLIPAGLMIVYMHSVAEIRGVRIAEAAAKEPEQEIKIDPVTGIPIDPKTDLIMGKGFAVMKKNCVRCHPTSIITTARMDRDGWLDAIRWMQEEKGLQLFNEKTEETLLEYLTTYYGS